MHFTKTKTSRSPSGTDGSPNYMMNSMSLNPCFSPMSHAEQNFSKKQNCSQKLGHLLSDTESEIEFNRKGDTTLNNTGKSRMKCSAMTESLLDSKNYKGGFRFINNNNKLTDFCINHSEKKSKYYLVEEKTEMLNQSMTQTTKNVLNNNSRINDNSILTCGAPYNQNLNLAAVLGKVGYLRGFCSKCAIRLAMNGLNIEELKDDDQQERKARIDSFLDKLGKLQILHQKKNICGISGKKDIDMMYCENLDKLELYFKEIIGFLNHEKKNMRDYLLAEKSRVFNKLDDYHFSLNSQTEELLRIRMDIEKNINQIVNNIELGPFTEILQNYEHTLHNFGAKLDEDVTLEITNLNFNSTLLEKYIAGVSEIITFDNSFFTIHQ